MKKILAAVAAVLLIACVTGFVLAANTVPAYDQLMEAESLSDFRSILLAEENREEVSAFTSEEIYALERRVDYLFEGILDPSGDDLDLRDEMLETLSVLPNGDQILPGDPVYYAALPTTINGSDTGIVETSQTGLALSGDYSFSGTITFKTRILVKSGTTLTISGNGTFTKAADCKHNDFFLVEHGAKLVLKGTSATSFVIDGNGASGSAIWCQGHLELSNVKIMNNHYYNYSGAAIYISSSNDNRVIKLTDCVISNCDAVNGSAIVLRDQTSGSQAYAQVILERVLIENCGLVDRISENAGNGGLIYNNNANSRYKLTIKDSVFHSQIGHSHFASLRPNLH